MTYPIPPDPRATDDFDIVRGWDTMDRRQFDVSDTVGASPLAVAVGEPVTFLSGSTSVFKADDILTGNTPYVIGTQIKPAPGIGAAGGTVAGISFSEYNSEFENGGHPDALKTGGVTVLQGKFSLKYAIDDAFFSKANLGVAPAVGLDVVAVYDYDAGPPAEEFVGFTCLSSDLTVRYAGVSPTVAEARIDASVIGKVSYLDSTHVIIDFNI